MIADVIITIFTLALTTIIKMQTSIFVTLTITDIVFWINYVIWISAATWNHMFHVFIYMTWATTFRKRIHFATPPNFILPSIEEAGILPLGINGGINNPEEVDTKERGGRGVDDVEKLGGIVCPPSCLKSFVTQTKKPQSNFSIG